ncbi:MAG: hypothetical protein AB1Z57_08260 [Acidimicrobiia bacterium]
MSPSERPTLVAVTGVVASVGLVAGLASGRLSGFYFPFSEGVLATACVLAGAVITARRPDHAVGRLLMWAGLVAASAQLMVAFADGPVSDPTTAHGVVGSVVSVLQFAALAMLTALIARFPDGAWTTPWSRRLYVAFSAAVAMHVVLLVVAVGDEASLGGIRLAPFRFVPILGFVLTVHVVVHLLRADPVRRRQMAWVLLAFVVALTPEALVEGLDLSLGVVGGFVRGLLVLLIPASIALAVTRHRLYEIDRAISRTLSYGIVVAAMAGVFSIVLIGLGLLFGGQGDLAVAIATLAAVAVSVPLVRRVRGWVDRRFFRSRYDAVAVVSGFAGFLRETIDADSLNRRAEAVVDEALAPEFVSVWVAEETANPGL